MIHRPDTLSGTTLELACLALGHDDAGAPACPAPVDDLVRQLVDEVQALRVAAGIVEESEVDRQEVDAALVDVLEDVFEAGVVPVHDLAPAIRVRLAEQGWVLHPVRRP